MWIALTETNGEWVEQFLQVATAVIWSFQLGKKASEKKKKHENINNK